MNNLPPEILHIILGHVPLPDLCQSHSRVCSQWRDVIQQENFMKWQKIYYKYRLGDKTAVSFLQDKCKGAGITTASDCFKNLLKFIVSSFPITKSGCVRAQESLRTHPFYSLAIELINENHGLLIGGQNDIPFWGIVTAFCMVSSDAWGIYDVIRILTSFNSEFMYSEVAEKLYCILSFFLYFSNEFKISSKFHYNLYQALQWYEENRVLNANVERSNPHEMLTHEQLKIVHHDLKSNEILKIVAFAGTGKTTTLIHFTAQNPNRKFLLLMFNRAASDDNARNFPGNVKCVTIHQLAFKYVGATYKNTHRKSIRNLSVFDLQRSGVLHDRKGFKRYQREAVILETLNRFMSSADKQVLLDHVPTRARRQDNHTQEIIEEMFTVDQRETLMYDARSLWSIICNTNDKRIPMPFDAFLKIWQLQEPNLFKLEKVDCIIVDEGQDMNSAMLDIFLRHKNGSRVIVGDPHQQIYQWRYAINALDHVTPTHTFYLTKSFRFGPEIAFMASSCLSYFKDVTKEFLIGSEIRDSLDRGEVDVATFDFSNGKQICFLARTNLGLFKKVMQIIDSQTKPLKIAFAGGIEKMGFDAILELCALRAGIKRGQGFPNRFGSIGEFKEYIEQVGDKEWMAKLAILEWGGERTGEHVNKIQQQTVNDMSKADIIFSTAHKAKGLEWDTVAVLDDFAPILEPRAHVGEEALEEANLLYVAVTRAKRHLIINPACYHVLLAVGDCQEKIVNTEDYRRTLPSDVCTSCRQLLPGQFEGRKASLVKLPLQISTIKERRTMVSNSGLLCSSCAGLPWYITPRFDCYTGYPPVQRLKENFNHCALRFLVGPPDEKANDADAFYQEHRAQMEHEARAIFLARRLV